MKNTVAKFFFIAIIAFLPPFGISALTDKPANNNFSPNILESVNREFLYDFFKNDTVKVQKYWDEICSGSLPKMVCVSIKNQELNVLDFTDTFRIVLKTKVSTGTFEKPTPRGEFKILEKLESRPSYKYGGIMLFWNRITTSVAIHGLQGTSYEKDLGKPVSHGCVRISNSVAKDFYEITPIGTLVLIE